MTPVTINTTDPQHVFVATVVDSSDNPLLGETGDSFAWAADDAGAFVNLAPNGNLVGVKPTGQVGTVNLSCTATKSGASTVTGSQQIIVQGPVRDHVAIAMQS